ncbi:MAG: putative HAD-hydrolase [Methanocella sp. PtaU1.Bin125]|nr:MAG: putative HAD-hydrolase [Methanocella sp. PtaU1.Bin125]
MPATCRIDTEKYRAVLFDLDGVITDTMGLHYEAYRQAFEKHDIHVTPLEVYLTEGMPSMEVGRAIVKEKGARIADDQLRVLIEDKREIYRALAAKDAKTFPGVPETLRMLRENGIRLALITGSNAKSVAGVIRKVGLDDAFDAVVAGDDTARGKPYPDPYRKGMERLGIPPEHCVVVENAPLGIQAAKAAGAGYVIAVTTTLPEQYLKDADDVTGSFADIEECLARRPGR